MTVMTMKEIVEFVEEVKESPHLEDSDDIEERVDQIDQAIESLAETSITARDIILKRMTEKEFAQFMNSISKITVFAALANEEGVGLMVSMATGELQAYTHSVILATIGALINEEVL